MTDYELQPCPFCGSSASIWGMPDEDAYCIECDNDYCGCEYGHNMNLTMEEVVKFWNHRESTLNNDTKLKET